MDYKDYLRKKKISLPKSDLSFELSSLITEARLYAGLSQAELAKKMGTTQSSIARAEGGEMHPSIEFLDRVAKAVGTHLVYPKFGFMIEREQRGTQNMFAEVRNSRIFSKPSMNLCAIVAPQPSSAVKFTAYVTSTASKNPSECLLLATQR